MIQRSGHLARFGIMENKVKNLAVDACLVLTQMLSAEEKILLATKMFETQDEFDNYGQVVIYTNITKDKKIKRISLHDWR